MTDGRWWQSALFACALLLSGCSGPLGFFPGGALAGPEAPFSAAAVPAGDTLIQLETLPSDPYSVNLNSFVIDGALYIDPAEDRGWYPNLVTDPNVRLKLDGDDTVYLAQVVRETDPAVLANFDADRIVFRLVAR